MLKICCLWLVLFPASAQIYKWVDESGRTHYGENPPRGAKTTELPRIADPVPPRDPAGTAAWREKDNEFRGRQIQIRQAEELKKSTDSANAQKCTQARDQAKLLRELRRIYVVNEKGERSFKSDAEREAEAAAAEKQIALHCN